MTGPSDAAINRTLAVADLDAVEAKYPNERSWVHHVLSVAHDPSLGLDRSVCLRDVIEALRAVPKRSPNLRAYSTAADLLERDFTT
jgi:hypothetical protein